MPLEIESTHMTLKVTFSREHQSMAITYGLSVNAPAPAKTLLKSLVQSVAEALDTDPVLLQEFIKEVKKGGIKCLTTKS